MSKSLAIRLAAYAVIALIAGTPVIAGTPALVPPSSHAQALDRMMVFLAPETARAKATISRVYRDHLELLFLPEYADLVGALATGGVAPLPDDPSRFNIVPRLDGPHPIGEKDLRHQTSYLAARPATIGALIELASRVRTGPLEITSLVRHGEYQTALRATNDNAWTSLPMHTMGLAFDIALMNTPIETVYEIRRALRAMRDAGDILFIGERGQLVFHVVPHPSRLGHFTDVYTRALGAPPAVAEGVSIVPGDERLRHEWLLALEPSPVSTALSTNAGVTVNAAALLRGLLALVAALGAAAYRIFLHA